MAPYNDDFLLVSMDDYAFDGTRIPDHSFAMDNSVVYGKFILVDKRTGENQIYASGIRNSQGVLIDPAGTIWSTDHGQGGGDELNLIVKGLNYGWPESTLSIDYDEGEWPYSEFQGVTIFMKNRFLDGPMPLHPPICLKLRVINFRSGTVI